MLLAILVAVIGGTISNLIALKIVADQVGGAVSSNPIIGLLGSLTGKKT